MRIIKYGHASLLVEGGGVRLLLDPGIYSDGVEDLDDITAVLITHAHADHLDVDKVVAIAARTPGLRVVCDRGSAESLSAAGLSPEVVSDGDHLDLGVTVSVHGEWHTPIHPDLPRAPNVAYLIGGALFHPGDTLAAPPAGVQVLAVPCGGPWLKLQEAIDYVRIHRPPVALPIHEAVLARPAAHYNYLTQLAPEGTAVTVLAVGESIDV